MSTSPKPPREDAVGTIYPALYYDDAPAAMNFLEQAFGFTRRLVVPGPGDTVMHAELSFGASVVMVATSRPENHWLSPRSLPGVHVTLSMYVDDPDAHCARARAHGATILREPRDEEYGARGYLAKDPEGNEWYFGDYRPGAYWEG